MTWAVTFLLRSWAGLVKGMLTGQETVANDCLTPLEPLLLCFVWGLQKGPGSWQSMSEVLLAGTVPKAHFSKPWKSLPLPSTPDTASGFLDSKDCFEGDFGWPSACSLSERKWNIITMQTKLLQEGSQHNVTMKWKDYIKITVQVTFCYTPMSLRPWDDTVAHYWQCKTALI